MTVRKWIHQMHTGVQYFACVLTLILLVVIQVTPAYAAVTKTNSDTNYEMIIDDVAGYFSDDEIQSLTDLMAQITDYCNVAVVTTESHGYSTTRRLAQAYFDDSFGIHASGSVFVIDRDLNEIYLYSAVMRTKPLHPPAQLRSQTTHTSTQPHPTDATITSAATKPCVRF